MKRLLISVLPVFVFLAAWEAVSRALGSPLFPPPSQVLSTFFSLAGSGVLLKHFLKTLLRVVIGFSLGSLLGILMGILMGWFHLLDVALSPIISIFYPIPALGWVPLLMLWLGIGEVLPIAVIFICSFFPVLYNTYSGVKNVDKNYVRVARTLGASSYKLLIRVVLPLSLPSIFTGLRLEAGMAWRVVVAAEMIAIPTGIGALMMKAENLIMVNVIMVCLMVLAVMSLIFERLVVLCERKTVGRWRRDAFHNP